MMKDVYFLFCIDELFNQLNGFKWFSIFDLNVGYW